MSNIDIEVPEDTPVALTICGDAGVGKTVLAASFPNPIFIRSEDGMKSIPKHKRPPSFPIVRSVGDVWDQLLWLLKNDHNYNTLVIDSVTTLERIYINELVESDGKAKSINQVLGGWGAGKNAVIAMHQRLRKGCRLLTERKGMNIVFIAHANIEGVRPPDGEDYQRYSINLIDDKSVSPYVNDVDLIGFIRLVTYVRGEDGERKRAVSTGERELVCHMTASSVAKNRYGIEDPIEIEQGVNPFLQFPNILISGRPTEKAKTDLKKAPAKAADHADDKPATEKETAQ